MTFVIIVLPQLGLPVAIIIPPIIINTNDIIKIRVSIILVKLHIKTGKAVVQLTLVSSALLSPVVFSIHFPIKGTLVLRDTPQQTPGVLQGLHILSTLFVPVGHIHHTLVPPAVQVITVAEGELAGVHVHCICQSTVVAVKLPGH